VMVTVLRVVLLVLYKESMNGGGIDVCVYIVVLIGSANKF
jgi:hypothetical protein